MTIFNEAFAGLIGFLIIVLGGYDTPTGAESASATSSPGVVSDVEDDLFDAWRESLIELEARIIRESDGFSFSDDSGEDNSDMENDSVDTEDDGSEKISGKDSFLDEDEGDGSDSRYEDDTDDVDEDENEGDDDEDRPSRTVAVPARAPQGGSSATISAGTATLPSFTLAEVARHNTSADCYSAISGSVYDLTKWIAQHPGGKSTITSLCGVDGSAAFNQQHGGSSKPNNILAAYKVGLLK